MENNMDPNSQNNQQNVNPQQPEPTNPVAPAAPQPQPVPSIQPKPISQAPTPQPVQQPMAAAQSATAVAQAPIAADQTFNIKVFHIKNLLVILGVVIIYIITSNTIPFIGFILFIASLIYAYMTVTKLKKDPALITKDDEKLKAVVLMTIDPLVVQAFYYYRLRKINPQAAGVYNKLGWKVLGVEFLLYIILFSIAIAVFFKHN